MANLNSILKSRDITLLTKVHLVKAMVFSVVMYGCESWTVKTAERWRIDAFELWCWRILLRVPWTARKSHQSILKEISPGCSFEELMLKLKVQYFGHLTGKVYSLEKTVTGSDWGQEEKGNTEDEMAGLHHRLNGHEFEWTPWVGDGQVGLACCNSCDRKELDMTEQLNWTELNENSLDIYFQVIWLTEATYMLAGLSLWFLSLSVFTHVPKSLWIFLGGLYFMMRFLNHLFVTHWHGTLSLFWNSYVWSQIYLLLSGFIFFLLLTMSQKTKDMVYCNTF